MANTPSIFEDFNRPMASLRPLLRQIDDMFNNVLTEPLMPSGERGSEWETRSLVPAVDIEEGDDHYLMSFDMPGLDKDNINIEVVGNQLHVSGERKFEKVSKTGRMRERRWGRFERSLTLPEEIKASDIEAQYRDGVLQIVVPRAAEAKHVKIKIDEGKQGFFKRLMGDGKRSASKEERQSSEPASKSGVAGTSSERFEPTH